MRAIAAMGVLCVLFLCPAEARSGPDCIRVLTATGYECVAKGSAQAAVRHAKASKGVARVVKVAGKKFRPSPVVSVHSSAAPWLAEAQRHIGSNPTGKRSLWCADFVNLTLKRTGRSGTGSRAAKSFLSHGRRVSPRPGAIAVYHRKRGGHVAIVEKVEGNRVTLVSGNCGRKGVCRYTRSVGSAS